MARGGQPDFGGVTALNEDRGLLPGDGTMWRRAGAAGEPLNEDRGLLPGDGFGVGEEPLTLAARSTKTGDCSPVMARPTT